MVMVIVRLLRAYPVESECVSDGMTPLHLKQIERKTKWEYENMKENQMPQKREKKIEKRNKRRRNAGRKQVRWMRWMRGNIRLMQYRVIDCHAAA